MFYIMRKGLKMLGIIWVSVLIGTFAMISVYMLPTEPMYRHVQECVKMLENENNPVYGWTGYDSYLHTHTKLNSWSDHIMLMHAIYPTSGPIVEEAMMNHRWLYAVTDITTTDVLLRNLNPQDAQDVESLYESFGLDGTLAEDGESMIYPRYWHGYLTVLKPALIATNVAGIRLCNFYLQFSLMILVVILLYRHLGALYVAAFSLVWLTINPVTSAMVFQIDAVLYIMLISVILILWKNEWIWKRDLYPYFFLMIGIFTAFFDFFTFPLVGLCIPWTVYFILNRYRISKKSSISNLFSHVICWGVGYAGMFSGKWFMSWILTGYNTFYDAFVNIEHRLSHTGLNQVPITPLDALLINIWAFLSDPIFLIILAVFAYFAYYIFIKRLTLDKDISLPFIIISIFPLIWYMILCNHSYISAGEVYRHLTITEFAALALFIENVRHHKNKIQ